MKGNQGDLDAQLTSLLEEASNGQGLDFFRMPSSTDLAAIPQDPRNPLNEAKVELGAIFIMKPALQSIQHDRREDLLIHALLVIIPELDSKLA